MRRLGRLALLAAVHLFLSVWLLFLTFDIGMEPAALESPGVVYQLLSGLFVTLMFPGILLSADWIPQPRGGFPFEHLPFLLNSFLWALGIDFLIRWRRSRSTDQSGVGDDLKE